MEGDKVESSKLLAKEIASSSDEKIPSKLISWLIDSIVNKHTIDPRNMAKDL